MIIIKGGVTYAYLQSERLSGHEPESSEYLICTGHHETKLCPGQEFLPSASAFRTKFVNDGFAEHIDQIADGIG